MLKQMFALAFTLLILFTLDFTQKPSKAQSMIPRVYLPLTSLQVIPPPSSESYYIKDSSSSAMWDLGCSLAQALSSSNKSAAATILHFGQPWNLSATQGVRIFDPAVSFITLDQVQSATQSFAGGYSYCSAFTYGNNTFLYIGVGVSNDGPQQYVSNVHGEAWGNAIDSIITALDGTISENRVFVLGAGDLEPGFNSPSTTINWVLGYFSQPDRFLYNFGTADGCPDDDVPGIFDGQCGTAEFDTWKQSHVWFISSGHAGLRAFPEIYAESGVNADQWYQIALYGYRTGQLFPFIVRGSLTQFEACNQRPGDLECDDSNPLTSLKNSPATGWSQFSEALRGDPRTNQTVPFSSDIQWQGE